jgi:hypothetical protein
LRREFKSAGRRRERLRQIQVVKEEEITTWFALLDATPIVGDPPVFLREIGIRLRKFR